MGSTASSKIQSVERATALMDCIAEAGHPLSLKEISDRTSIAKSTAHGILSTLVNTGMIQQINETGQYWLGNKVDEFSKIKENAKEF